MVVVVFNITIQTANIFKNKCSQNNKVNNVLQTLLWQLLFVIHIWNADFPLVSVVNSNKLLLVVWVLWRYFSTVVINAWPHDIYCQLCKIFNDHFIHSFGTDNKSHPMHIRNFHIQWLTMDPSIPVNLL